MEDEKKFSQEDLDGILKERLAREKSKQTELEAKLQEVTKAHDELVGKHKEAEDELPRLRKSALVSEVVRELNIPDALALRLKGDTKAELLSDGKKLLADLEAIQNKGIPLIPGSKGEPKLSPEQRLQKMMAERRPK